MGGGVAAGHRGDQGEQGQEEAGGQQAGIGGI